MKSTDIMRKDRNLRKQEKKRQLLERYHAKRRGSVGEYINILHDLFYFDQTKIYNIDQSEEILELLTDLREEHPEKQWFAVVNKAVRKTKVEKKDEAIRDLCELGDIEIPER